MTSIYKFLTFNVAISSSTIIFIYKEFKRMVSRHLALPPAGPPFYAHAFHPAFNLDAEEAKEAVHTKAVGKGVQGLRNIFGRIREARVGKLVVLSVKHLIIDTFRPNRNVQG
jgi:hypothetical protein